MGAQYVLPYSEADGFVLGGYSIVVIRDLPKVKRGVRFPLPAQLYKMTLVFVRQLIGRVRCRLILKSMNKNFSISQCFSVGWARFKEHPWFFIGLNLLLWVVAGISGYLTDIVYVDIEPTRSLTDLLCTVLYYWVMFGFIALTLRAIDGKSLSWDQFLKMDRRFVSYLIGLLLYGVMVLVGVLAFVVPGVYLAIRYGFFWYGIIDGRKGVMESFQESARITDGVKWQIVLFGMTSMVVIFLGMVCLGVGVLVAVPVAMLASAHLYRVLLSQSNTAPKTTEPSTSPREKSDVSEEQEQAEQTVASNATPRPLSETK